MAEGRKLGALDKEVEVRQAPWGVAAFLRAQSFHLGGDSFWQQRRREELHLSAQIRDAPAQQRPSAAPRQVLVQTQRRKI